MAIKFLTDNSFFGGRPGALGAVFFRLLACMFKGGSVTFEGKVVTI